MKYEYACRYCGTYWVAESGTYIGFLSARVNHHIYTCETKSPSQRLRWIENTKKRLNKNHNKHVIVYFDPRIAEKGYE